MTSLLLALAPALVPVQSGCDTVVSVVYRDQGAPSGPIQLGHLGLPLVGGRLPRLLVDGGAPGSPGFVGFGVDPLTLPIGPGATLFTLPLSFVPFALDGEGSADLDLAPGFVLPPSSCGSLLVFQLGVLDPAATGGIWYSDGLELRPGDAFDEPAFGGARFGEFNDPVALAHADLDGDGFEDLLVAAQTDDALVTMFGDGVGGFVQGGAWPVHRDPFQLALADFDEDGTTDVVVGHRQLGPFVGQPLEAEPMVLLGNGDGSFGPAQPLPSGGGGGVAAGDLDGDGHVDVVCLAGAGVDEVVVFHGDGTGGFAAPVRVPVSIYLPWRVGLADLDGNGTLDVVANSRSHVVEDPVSDDRLVLVLNDGQRGYAVSPQSPLIAVHRIQDFALADADDDGAVDVLGAGMTGPRITAFLNDGGGIFSSTQTTAFGGASGIPGGPGAIGDLLAHDFDLDGLPDIALTFPNSRALSLYRGKGDGRFTFASSRGTGRSPFGLTLVDTNGDALEDFVVGARAIFSDEDDLLVLPAVEDFEFDGSGFGAVGTVGNDLAVLPRDDHGASDLVVVGSSTGDVQVLENDGAGELQTVQTIATAPGAEMVVVADVDGDGFDDLVLANSMHDSVDVVAGNPDGTFGALTSSAVTAGSEPVDLTVGDFDEDGVLDVVTANEEDGSYTLMLGVGDGSFTLASETFLQAQRLRGAEALDVNGDGHLDLALTMRETFGPQPRLVIAAGAGDGTFTEIFSTWAVSEAWDLAVGDLDGDGFDDAAVADISGSTFVFFGGLTVGPASLFELDYARPEAVAIADVDGDGVDELGILSDDFHGQVTILRSPGPGSRTLDVVGDFTIAAASNQDAFGFLTALVITDLDGDQRNDLVASSGSTGSIAYSLQRTPSPLDD